MNLFYQPEVERGVNYLDEEESRHCIKVLRHRSGDPIRLTDGNGTFYDATIETADARRCTFNITHRDRMPLPSYRIEIAVAPTKNADRMEWFVEKAVEIGIHHITFVDCKHSERRRLNLERISKVAITAMKQSIKAWLPEIRGPISFREYISSVEAPERFIAVVDPENPVHLFHRASKGTRIAVVIGPEGDFAAEEVSSAIDYGFVKVSLGGSRLRTETAALAACHILNLVNEPA